MKIRLIAALATILVPFAAQAQTPQPVKVGLIVPLSGPWVQQPGQHPRALGYYLARVEDDGRRQYVDLAVPDGPRLG